MTNEKIKQAEKVEEIKGGIDMETKVEDVKIEVVEFKEGLFSKAKGWAKKNKGVLFAAGIGLAAGVYVASRKGNETNDDLLELKFDEEDETFKYDEGYSNGDEEA